MNQTNSATPRHAVSGHATSTIQFRSPTIEDGARLWQIAADSRVLDVNSSYSYVLWCRDFARTSIVAEDDGRVVGFVTGYLRPDAPNTLFVWQVAVDESQRGKGVGVTMLDHLLEDVAPESVTRLETTVSPDNAASIAMFTSLARRRGVPITKQTLFNPEHFPDNHEAEELYVVGPQENRKENRTK
jgi:diaminobutyrate acetyltransferase